jgi:hypothetical protein
MKYNITNSKELDEAIHLLENELELQKKALTSQFNIIHESFNPFAFVKDLFKQLIASEKLRNNILKATLGFSAGYFTKKLFFRKSKNPLKIFLGNLIQYGVAAFIAQPVDAIKRISEALRYFNEKDEEDSVTPEPGIK